MGYHVTEETRWRVAALMDKIDREHWDVEIEDRLLNGHIADLDPELRAMGKVSKDEAAAIMTEAEEEWEHGERIILHRRRLHESIADAGNRITWALKEIEALSEMGDAEYMDGHADLEAFLNDAARALRAAQKIKPTDKNGST